VIGSFRDRRTEDIWLQRRVRSISAEIQRLAFRKLKQIDAAVDVRDLRVPPGNRLEALHGDRDGQFLIRINAQWRLCFIWRNGNVCEVEFVDYH
jgi:toxin HigB-1